MLTTKEVAARLKLSIRAVERLRKSGAIVGHKFGGARRYEEQRIEAYINDSADVPVKGAAKRSRMLVIPDYYGEKLRLDATAKPPRGGRRPVV